MGSIEDQHDKLGWIGAGRMGFAMADRLVSAGIPLNIWNRTASKAGPLARNGARIVDQLTELGSCDIVFMIVASSHDVSDGVVAALPDGIKMCQRCEQMNSLSGKGGNHGKE
jgi:3-hydroxyisobutyrate dehydrogenase-like beta-hydroxyacid dehydrogenase